MVMITSDNKFELGYYQFLVWYLIKIGLKQI
jgi:hypothetical protein